MITMVTIKNFKSLSDFSMPFDQFNCLIGLNGSGKTTVLQALDFIGHLACGKTNFRDWEKKDYITNGSNLRTITFLVEILPSPENVARIQEQYKNFILDRLLWFGKYNVDRQRFTEEQITSAVYSDSPPYLSWKD
ncbi:MAG: AAA family ATPase, partial [Treponema sp.]|nr:AAA family ATPase [Treponema sp.]